MYVNIKERSYWYSRIYTRYMNRKYGIMTWPAVPSRIDKLVEGIDDALQWLYNQTIRRAKDLVKPKFVIDVDMGDVMNADITMAHMIVNILRALDKHTYSIGQVADEDCPPDLNSEERYRWLLSEVIWAFEQQYNGSTYRLGKLTKDQRQAFKDRIENGRRLFVKYFDTFWI